jgi:hypothetical protein
MRIVNSHIQRTVDSDFRIQPRITGQRKQVLGTDIESAAREQFCLLANR